MGVELKAGKAEVGTDRERSAFRALVDSGAETTAILLAFRGPVAEPIGQSGSGQKDKGGDFEDDNHGGYGVPPERTLRS